MPNGVRLNPSHDKRTREKIKTSQLLNRLTSFALGGNDLKTGKPIEMSAAQVTAALGVLRKALPDMSNVQHEGEIGLTPIQELLKSVDQTEGHVRRPNGHDGSGNGATRV